MQRVTSEEILDSSTCPPAEVELSLRDLCRINRWFGGVATTRRMIQRVASVTGRKHFQWLEVAAGYGEVPRSAGRQLSSKGIQIEVTDLDRVFSHLRPKHRALVADALAIPFRDASFDVVSCSLFAHHLQPDELAKFVDEAIRVSRYAVLINDLIRHPIHLALVYAGFQLMRSYVSRVDGVASVKRAYTPEEVQAIINHGPLPAAKVEVSRNYLFRMGVIVWKEARNQQSSASAA